MGPMIETKTSWADSGFDCDHCGGRILRRTDQETGQPDRTCLQCEQCGCQWTLGRQPLRVGHRKGCRAAQSRRQLESTPLHNYDRWLLLVVGALFLFALLRFGGGLVIRYLLPILLVGVAVFILLRVGRRQEWW